MILMHNAITDSVHGSNALLHFKNYYYALLWYSPYW